MVQKEVAERLCAKIGTKDARKYNIYGKLLYRTYMGY